MKIDVGSNAAKKMMLHVFLISICILSNFSALSQKVVSTNYGKIKGFVQYSTKGREFSAFHRIPYAKPPTGGLRLKDPVPPDPWTELLDGTLPPVECPQIIFKEFVAHGNVSYKGVEDCLHLSVYTPQNGENLPVMLFIHGGVFVIGSSTQYTAEEFLNEDVVLVVINYRLGVLGFLSSEDDVIPGNFGLKDQLMAMQWTKENIKAFGGDPNRITIFGQSAGGFSLHYHILSSRAEGLFQRAILQSGTAICPWTKSINQRFNAAQVASLVGCFTPASTGSRQSSLLLSCLQNADLEQLTVAFTNFMVWTYLPRNFGPYIDYDFIPNKPEVLLRRANYKNIDVMIGFTKDDGASFAFDMLDGGLSEHGSKLSNNPEYYGPLSIGLSYENDAQSIAKKVYEYYTEGEYTINDQNAHKFKQLFTERNYVICSEVTALQQSVYGKKTNNKVFLYQFDYKGSMSLSDNCNSTVGNEWIGHTDELWYLFGGHKNKNFTRERNSEEKRVSETMIKLWTNFAADGNPTPDNSLGFTWTPFTVESPFHLSITEKPTMKPDSRQDARAFWKSLPTVENELLFGDVQESSKNECTID